MSHTYTLIYKYIFERHSKQTTAEGLFDKLLDYYFHGKYTYSKSMYITYVDTCKNLFNSNATMAFDVYTAPPVKMPRLQ